nr:MAG: hypothetical protein JST_5640 [Candidatus Parcubacteria bacterium]
MIKTLVWLSYLLLLIVFYRLGLNKKKRDYSWLWAWLSLAAAYFYGIFLQFYFSYRYQIPFWKHSTFGFAKEISSTVFYHNHIVKGVVGWLFTLFNKPETSNFDAGQAYLGWAPTIFWVFGALVLIILVGLSVFYFSTSFQKHLEKTNKRQKCFLIFSYSILAFALIETAFDGGLLVRGAALSFLAIPFFGRTLKNKKISNYFFLVNAFLSFIVSVLFYHYRRVLDPGGLYNILLTVSFWSLLNFLLYFSQKKLSFLVVLAVTASFFGSWWHSSYTQRNIIKYYQVSVSQGESFLMYDYQNNTVKELAVSKDGVLGGLNTQGVNISYGPITIPDKFCSYHRYILITGKILFKDYVPENLLSIHPYSYVWHGTPKQRTDGLWETRFEMKHNNCLPEPWTVSNRAFHQEGFNSFILLDLRGL